MTSQRLKLRIISRLLWPLPQSHMQGERRGIDIRSRWPGEFSRSPGFLAELFVPSRIPRNETSCYQRCGRAGIRWHRERAINCAVLQFASAVVESQPPDVVQTRHASLPPIMVKTPVKYNRTHLLVIGDPPGLPENMRDTRQRRLHNPTPEQIRPHAI
ncbi:hypothetical protein F4861DRAFT_398024 [Xylaria intraflava]|nr:hypothetical protein F4861DRAFT_398024 [Xylaria intraflava]